MNEQNKRKLRKVVPVVVVTVTVAGLAVGLSDTVRQWLGFYDAEFPGERTRFRPVSSYHEVAELAGPGVELRRLEARYVRSDGTVNLEADYEPTVKYDFIRKRTNEKDKENKRAHPRGTGKSRGAFELIEIGIQKPRTYSHSRGGGCSGGSEKLTPYMWRRKVRVPDTGRLAKPPKCSFSHLWQKAAKEGMPTDAVAIIKYRRSGYEFSIQGEKKTLRFDTECRLRK